MRHEDVSFWRSEPDVCGGDAATSLEGAHSRPAAGPSDSLLGWLATGKGSNRKPIIFST